MRYAELTCRSNHTFITGASHPEELVDQAKTLGLDALALTDRDGVYGIVKAHLAAQKQNLKLLIGSELTLDDHPPLTLIAQDPRGYENLSRLITTARTTRPKGQPRLALSALDGQSDGLFAILRAPPPESLGPCRELFGDRLHLALARHLEAGDEARNAPLIALAHRERIPLVATNDVHFHIRERKPLCDLLACIREKTSLPEAGHRLFPNAERRLKSPAEMARLFADLPEALEATVAIADACSFRVSQLAYHFPAEDLPPGETPSSWLRHLVQEGARERYRGRLTPDVRTQLDHELRLIDDLGYPGYFLTLHSLIVFARSRGILCQGRGSAANSAVCYCLGLTAIDPIQMRLLFERFLSRERNEPPDIDIDFQNDRREEVLQHIYEKYGRDRAAMVCEVISWRGKSALRDAAKAFGLSVSQADALAQLGSHHSNGISLERAHETGLDPTDPTIQRVLQAAEELTDFPRHLSIHTGGFAITQGPLHALVPIESASMENRTVVQWDKDDLSAAGILKVDLLALGMLTALSKTFVLIRQHEGRDLTLATIPTEDPAVYDMICDADTVGVFQIESRAQMSMLPRLKPRKFYDLVVEVAIVRPGPIVGKLVHPYLRRRDGKEPITYPHPGFQPILERTMGVALFQEQVMRLAVEVAGFSLGDADELRRAMSHKRGRQKLLLLRERFLLGLENQGLTRQQGEAVFAQFEGFSDYGFPESHAASFALIVYASSWLKRYYPAAFTCGLLNAQPMGFYAPHTLIDDARRHGVSILPIDCNASDWDATLEAGALRLGLRSIRSFPREAGRILESERRRAGPYRSLTDLWHRTHLSHGELAHLAAANALAPLVPERRQALWEIFALPVDEGDLLARLPPPEEPAPDLPTMSRSERLLADIDTTGTSLTDHPMALVREGVTARLPRSAHLQKSRTGQKVSVAGMVIARQRPPTAHGMCFMTLEDENGFINVITLPEIYEEYRRTIVGHPFLLVTGKIERQGKVINIKAESFEALELGRSLPIRSHDFH